MSTSSAPSGLGGRRAASAGLRAGRARSRTALPASASMPRLVAVRYGRVRSLPVLRALDLLQPQHLARTAVAADQRKRRVVGVDGDRVLGRADSLSTSCTWCGPKARPLPAGSCRSRSTSSASSRVFQPSVGSRTARECSLSSPAAVAKAPMRLGVVVPARAGAGRPADEPGLAAAGAVEPEPGAALGVEGEGGDQLGVGGRAAYEVEEFGLGGGGGACGRLGGGRRRYGGCR